MSSRVSLMPVEHISDWRKRIERADAFWANEIIDRPVVCISFPKQRPSRPWPAKRSWPAIRDRWMDTEFTADLALSIVMNTEYMGDALPAAGRNRFYTGITDLHPGGDAIAAFRDPETMNVDMIENPDGIRKLLRLMDTTYFRVYDFYHGKLRDAGQAITSWPGIVSTKKWYVPSNDFSCMVSKAMFDEFFLPGLREECRHMEASIYHLDGPGALRHLDSLLEIRELNAIQWVYGAGNEPASKWMHVYRRCQQAGKGLQIGLETGEIDCFMENLRPQGLWLSVGGVRDREQAEAIIRKMSKWR